MLLIIAILLAAILWALLSEQGKLLVKAYGLIALAFVGIGAMCVIGFIVIMFLGAFIRSSFGS